MTGSPDKIDQLLQAAASIDRQYWESLDLHNKILKEAVRRLLDNEEGAQAFAVAALEWKGELKD